ncbi:hypothetical protein BDN71DRAFT_1442361 [Pleurotus eryngii]|uniref:Uncharacterized protein n=1 Tax=Pleurotus eryngii TaxID=5323 RepID=A0A9P6A595_PLEER|nr:hypothetical protein BDN71DRAFT_1442361 [Pleurotus eryngii]
MHRCVPIASLTLSVQVADRAPCHLHSVPCGLILSIHLFLQGPKFCISQRASLGILPRLPPKSTLSIHLCTYSSKLYSFLLVFSISSLSVIAPPEISKQRWQTVLLPDSKHQRSDRSP